MSEEKDLVFAEFLPAITLLEKRYEALCPTKTEDRGDIGYEILQMVKKADLNTEYLLYCEHQAQGELTERQRDRVDLMIRILGNTRD